MLPRATAAYLAARTRFGIKFGLERMRALLDALDRPEAGYPSLLVAGTNGKGSVVAYVDAALRAGGLRVGRYTSPHLVRVNERIAVNGHAVADAALARAVARVRAVAERLERTGGISEGPTYFETLTATAFEHFRRARVDVAVLEVGMGGRLDATNAKDPVASAIVTLARDHEAYLGRTLAAIAREKAGVLRRGRVTVLGQLPVEARRAVAGAARRTGARLLDAWDGVRLLERDGLVDVETPLARYPGVRPLPGAHQRHNLVVALRLIEQARAAGIAVDLEAARRGLSGVRWPGRLQWLPGNPPLLLDGAHNPAGARAHAAYQRALGPCVLQFGMMRDKNASGLARASGGRVTTTSRASGNRARAAPPQRVVRAGGRWARRVSCEPAVGRALALARRKARGVGPVVVAGSLYLVGDVLRRVGPR